jgi:hypothetical protein
MAVSNTGKKWTTEDDNMLVCKYLQGYGYEAISEVLGRTVDAVQCRLVKVYIYPLMRNIFYTDKNTFNKLSLNGYDSIILRYSTFYKIEPRDFSRFLRYVDKNIKQPSVSDKQTLNLPINSKVDNSKIDVDNSKVDNSKIDVDNEFLNKLKEADKYKLNYYKYKYLYRLQIIHNILK